MKLAVVVSQGCHPQILYHSRILCHPCLLDTLVRARELAILNMDFDIRDINGNVIPGMAETITRLGDQLYSDAFQKIILQEKPVLSVESKDQKLERENTKKGNTLPSITEKDGGGWYGALGDQFCFKVIGDAIQMGVTPRIRQILKTGAQYVRNDERKIERSLDIGGADFNVPAPDTRLGMNSYYGYSGPGYAHGVGPATRRFHGFLNLLETITSASELYTQPILPTTKSTLSV